MQIYKSQCRFIHLRITADLLGVRHLMKKLIATHTKACMCMLDCYLLEHALVCNSIAFSLSLSLSAQGSCLSNKPNLPVTPQS